MALSKMPLLDDQLLLREKLELEQDKAIDEMLEAAFGDLPAFRRKLRPLVEIGLDCCELGASLTRSLLSIEARHPAVKRWQGGPLELQPYAEFDEPEAEAEDDAALFSLPLVRRRLRCRLEGLMLGLAELADDLGMDRLQVIRSCTMLGALLIPGASVGGAALGSLTALGSSGGSLQVLLQLGGFDIPTKGVVAGSVLFYAVGMWLLYNRHPETQCRTMQNAAAATALVAMLGELGLFCLNQFGVPEEVALHVAKPILAAKLLPCVVCLPLVLGNVGYISGKPMGKMKTCISLAILGSAGAIGSCVANTFQHQCLLLLGSAGFTLTAVTLLGELPNEAAMLSTVNKRRSMVSADLLSFAWTGIPLVQGMGILNIVNENLELKLLELLLATMFMGTHHITLRSSTAVEKAIEVVEKEPRRNNAEAPGQREPLNEADIQALNEATGQREPLIRGP